MSQVLITPTHVAYDACPTGYTVRVLSANATVAEYSTGNSRQMEGCRSLRIGVRWPNGYITWPCLRGIDTASPNDWQIL